MGALSTRMRAGGRLAESGVASSGQGFCRELQAIATQNRKADALRTKEPG